MEIYCSNLFKLIDTSRNSTPVALLLTTPLHHYTTQDCSTLLTATMYAVLLLLCSASLLSTSASNPGYRLSPSQLCILLGNCTKAAAPPPVSPNQPSIEPVIKPTKAREPGSSATIATVTPTQTVISTMSVTDTVFENQTITHTERVTETIAVTSSTISTLITTDTVTVLHTTTLQGECSTTAPLTSYAAGQGLTGREMAMISGLLLLLLLLAVLMIVGGSIVAGSRIMARRFWPNSILAPSESGDMGRLDLGPGPGRGGESR